MSNILPESLHAMENQDNQPPDEPLRWWSLYSQELLDKAKGLIAKGFKMIETNDQAKDQIKLKCDEIKELCEKFDKAVQKREEDLKKAMDIHECLEMVKITTTTALFVLICTVIALIIKN